MSAMNIAVLVSAGRHPASGRARRADLDARALELALGLAPPARLHVAHAGDPDEPALRDYLGMGIGTLTALALPRGADPVPALAAHLRGLEPDLVLCGAVAESGLCSGQLPYALAARLASFSGVTAGLAPAIRHKPGESLDAPVKPGHDNGGNGGARDISVLPDYALAPNIVAVEIAAGSFRLLQALPRGRRRALEAAAPLIATVDRAAPPARASAYGPARRGRVVVLEAAAPGDAALTGWREQPARRRPKRLRVATGSAAERLRAATEMPAARGRLLVDPPPEEAAQAIWEYLVSEGILRSE